MDWDGYTIGYYGRIFEARNKTKGGSFEVYHYTIVIIVKTQYCFSQFSACIHRISTLQGDDKSFYRFRLGSHEVCLFLPLLLVKEQSREV